MSLSDVFRLLRRFASQNLALKAVALVLAVAAWAFVAGESKVLVSFNIPLEIRDIPKDMIMTNKPERQVEVRLTGPASILSGLRPTEISAAVDLSGGRAGRQTVVLDDRVVKVPTGIKVQRVFPSAIDVNLERTERRSVAVLPRIGGGPEVRRRISRVEVDPKTVEVEALPDSFSRMTGIYTAEVTPEADGEVFTSTARVELREPHAKIVGNPNVRVKIHFRK